jgi:putative protein-disulfide isomerase
MSELLDVPGVTVALLPTGLFSGERARSMDDAFATSAWSNDRGIERLTGQRFTEQYRHRVLGNRQQRFDSGPATVALTAVSLTDPGRELEALKALQHARYVDGGDVTSPATVAGVLHDLDLENAATLVANPDAGLFAANRARIDRAQSLMQEFGARGVPTLIAESGAKRWMVNPSAAYSNPRALISELEAV